MGSRVSTDAIQGVLGADQKGIYYTLIQIEENIFVWEYDRILRALNMH